MVLRVRNGRMRTAVVLGLLAAFAFAFDTAPARAQFDFFGLFGSDDEPPPPSPDALPYDFEIVIEGEADGVENALESISTLYRLRGEPPPDAEALVRRAQSDIVPFIDALWGSGYYNARVGIEVAGVTLTIRGDTSQAAIAAASGFRNRALVPIRVVIEPREVFRLRTISLVGPQGEPLALPEDVFTLEPGLEAQSATILAAQADIVDYYRAQSRPFAAIAAVDPVVVHPEGVMDIAIRVEPGPIAGIGPIAVTGNEGVPERVIRSFIYSDPGDPYSPESLASIRRSVSQIEAISAVRIRQGEALDENGNLPLELNVTERLPRLFGVAASYSTTDGPAANVYWAHRNLFGGAERLRLDASVFYLTQSGAGRRADDEWYDDLGGRVSASFLKPALWGTRNDFLADAVVSRDRTAGYTAELVNVTLAVRRRFSETFSIRGGVLYEAGQGTFVLGDYDYQLVGIPLGLDLDTTDSRLDPREGVRVRGAVTPYFDVAGTSSDFTYSRLDASTYFALDARRRFVLAGRVGFGSIVGADLEDVPPNLRFFAGGGGSVRGYAYRSLGPRLAGEPIGGRSLLEGSLEARLRVTDTIGIVPFVDAGAAFAESYPSFDEEVRYAAGVGLRYHTPIGPLRVDVAVPLNPEEGDDRFGLYLGIGQSF